MSIDIERLVEIDLEPVFELDPTIQLAIPSRIEAEKAVRGWVEADMTDKRAVYVATVVTRSFVARLLLKFSQEIKKAGAGKAAVEFDNAIKYLEALRHELDERIRKEEIGIDPELIPSEIRWPGVGIIGF